MVRQRHNERQREFKRREDFVIQAQTRLWKERERKNDKEVQTRIWKERENDKEVQTRIWKERERMTNRDRDKDIERERETDRDRERDREIQKR